MMQRQQFIGALAAAGVTLVPRRPARADDVVLRLAATSDDDVTPVLWADHAGWFKDAGISIHIDHMNNGSASAAAVAGGAIDIGKTSTLPVILAHARGLPLTIVAPGGLSLLSTVYSGLIVRKDSAINVAADLNGKVVSVPGLNDLQSLATQAWIDKHGGNSKTVSFIEEPGTTVGIALDANRIAAGTLSNPALSTDMATGKYRNIGRPLEGIGDRLLTSIWISDANWATKNAALVRKFSEIVARGAAYANTHHDDTVDLIVAYSGLQRDTVKTMVRAMFPDKLDPALVQPVIDVAARYGAIKQSFKATDVFFSNASVR